MKTLIVTTALLAASLAGTYAAPAQAFTAHTDKYTHKPFHIQAISDREGALGFTAEERRIIREVLGTVKRVHDYDREDDRDRRHGKKHDRKHGGAWDDGKSLPHGLAKRGGDLPPGLERHIEKYGTLPPGLEGRALPDDLERRLPKSRKGTKRVIVDNDVLLIEEATGVVLDILKDVFGN
jgi:Ni/Co efflux regulator RcnB